MPEAIVFFKKQVYSIGNAINIADDLNPGKHKLGNGITLEIDSRGDYKRYHFFGEIEMNEEIKKKELIQLTIPEQKDMKPAPFKYPFPTIHIYAQSALNVHDKFIEEKKLSMSRVKSSSPSNFDYINAFISAVKNHSPDIKDYNRNIENYEKAVEAARKKPIKLELTEIASYLK